MPTRKKTKAQVLSQLQRALKSINSTDDYINGQQRAFKRSGKAKSSQLASLQAYKRINQLNVAARNVYSTALSNG